MQLTFPQALNELLSRLSEPERALEAISKNLCEEAIDLIKEEFEAETDPYGATWQPKQRPDGRKTLSGPTARLKTGWHKERVDATGFEVAPSVKYAAYHQRGNPRLPRRMMVPDEALGLPLSWQHKFEATAEETMQALFGEGKTPAP